MRVISGSLGSRTFNSPKTHRTHPMSERTRGGLFAALGDIEGLTVLDVFAGSGALAIEAISRGAASAQTIESDRAAQSVIAANVKELHLKDKIKATQAYFSAWSKRNQKLSYDLVLADPPYNDIPYSDLKVLPRHLKDGGVLVLSWPGNLKLLGFDGLELVRHKSYGDSQLVFYKKIS